MRPPQWHALQCELEELCLKAHAENAYVRDAWGNRWCSARPFTTTIGTEVDAVLPPPGN